MDLHIAPNFPCWIYVHLPHSSSGIFSSGHSSYVFLPDNYSLTNVVVVVVVRKPLSVVPQLSVSPIGYQSTTVDIVTSIVVVRNIWVLTKLPVCPAEQKYTFTTVVIIVGNSFSPDKALSFPYNTNWTRSVTVVVRKNVNMNIPHYLWQSIFTYYYMIEVLPGWVNILSHYINFQIFLAQLKPGRRNF